MIEHYATGRHMKIAGKRYHQDLKIIGDRVKENWWRNHGHRLDIDDIADILSAKPEVLVIGTGYAGNLRIPAEVRTAIENHDISIVAHETAKATTIFNRLYNEGKDVAGAFHLTC